MQNTNDLRVLETMPLTTPDEIKTELPMRERAAAAVFAARAEISDVVHGRDSRLLVIAGPCSIHDVESALEYAERFRVCRERYADSLLLCMRGYFEKPRTTIGWKGL